MDSLVIFDLDDTLIDTQGVLLGPALVRVAATVGVDPARLDATGKRIDEVLAPLGELPADVTAAAARVWYDPTVPPLDPLPGARAMLESLRGRIHMALLTRGNPDRQQAKIAACGLADEFEDIRIRAIEEPGSKRDDIVAAAERFGVELARTAVVGDDPRDELRHADALGCAAIAVPETALGEIPARLAALGLIDRP
ncbi:MAG: HAD family hydrolase [Planctomycetota bacterium]|jgi:FMN phosphatase YigB (HAD superfamily)